MDKQAIFDRVVTHLLTQKRRSVTITGGVRTCMYRAPNGDMCAIGCLIPDDVYTPCFMLNFNPPAGA